MDTLHARQRNTLACEQGTCATAPNMRRPRRPFTYIATAYITGIAFCYYYAPPVGLMIVGLAGLAAYALISGFRHLFVLLFATAFLAGAIYADASFNRADPLEQQMTNGVGYAEGIVGRVLFAEQRDTDYRLLTIRADGRKLIVRQYGEEDKPMTPKSEEMIGKLLLIRGKLSYPDTARNPRGFDYRLYLLSKGIRVIVTCERPGDIVVLNSKESASANPLWESLGAFARAKASFTERIHAILPSEKAALFVGMMFGDKEAMDEETYELFKRNGVAHILSVSGLHIGMVYAFVSTALGRRKTIRFYITVLILLFCYAALSSFSPSVMRAFSMIGVHIAAKLLNRRYDMLTGILFSALIMLVLNPLALFGAGFLLSYTAVCSISFTLPHLNRHTGFRNKRTGRTVKEKDLSLLYGVLPHTLIGGRLLALLLPTALIQIFILPLTVYFFNCLPLLAVLVNIPVIALASFIVPFGIVVLLMTTVCAVLPSLVFALGPAADVGVSSAGILIDLMLFLTQAADAIPNGSLTVPSPPFPLIILFYGAAYYLLSDTFAMNRRVIPSFFLTDSSGRGDDTRFRYDRLPGLALPAILLVAFLLAACTPFGKQNDAPYTFVDVGQGDCLHIRTKDGRNYLMDGGGKYDYNVGKNVLAPYLLKNGVGKLDGVFVSHPHMDHLKGLSELAALMDIGFVYVYDGHRANTKSITRAFPTSGTFPVKSLRYLSSGDIVPLGAFARAEVLFPPKRADEIYLREMTGDIDENRASLIIRFENEGIRVLMTGDTSKEGEAAALQAPDIDLSCDILKIGHHGSKTSTSDALLTNAEPAAAVIQVGKNHYGHPAPKTLEKLSAAGIPFYRNDTSGAVLIRSAPGGFAVQNMKRDLIPIILQKAYERTGTG